MLKRLKDQKSLSQVRHPDGRQASARRPQRASRTEGPCVFDGLGLHKNHCIGINANSSRSHETAGQIQSGPQHPSSCGTAALGCAIHCTVGPCHAERSATSRHRQSAHKRREAEASREFRQINTASRRSHETAWRNFLNRHRKGSNPVPRRAGRLIVVRYGSEARCTR